MLTSIKMRLARRFAQFARARGYEITPLWRLKTRPLALHLRELLAKYQIDCVLDVGGNLGQYHDLLRNDVGWQGLVLSFEPVRKYAEYLRGRSADDPNWRIFDYALGSNSKRATINVTHSPGLNSFLDPRTDAVPGFWTPHSITHTEVVQINTLDDIFSELREKHAFSSPYLKLDTQGFDLEVVKGGVNSITNFRALQTEASVKPIYVGQPGFVESLQYFGGLGFEVSGIFPVTHDEALRLVEFDCTMVNRCFADLPGIRSMDSTS